MGQDQAYPTTVKLGLPSIPIPHFETHPLINAFFSVLNDLSTSFLPPKGRQMSLHKKVITYKMVTQLLSPGRYYILTVPQKPYTGVVFPQSHAVPGWRGASSSDSLLLHGCPKGAASSHLNSVPYCKQQR